MNLLSDVIAKDALVLPDQLLETIYALECDSGLLSISVFP
jgi:hypothetical protein